MYLNIYNHIKEENQVEKEPQHPIFQHTSENTKVQHLQINDDPTLVGDAAATLTTSVKNMAQEKQPIQFDTTQQFRDPLSFP